MSPAQKLYGRPIQDSLPAHRRSFAAEWQQPISEEQTQGILQKAESFYDQHAHPLPDLSPGAQVAIQNPVSKRWDVYGVVTAVSPHRRYSIRTSSGQVFVCNRHFLRKRTAPSIYAPTIPTQALPRQKQSLESTLPPDPEMAPRRSERSGRGTRQQPRLVEDDTWG